MANPYDRQVAPQRIAREQPFARPEDYGADVGQSIVQIGSQLGQRVVQQKRVEAERDYDRENIAAMLEFEKMRERVAIADNEARSNAVPGAVGHHEAMAKLVDDERDQFLSAITNRDLRDRYAIKLQSFRTDRVTEADAYERGATAKLMATQLGAVSDMMSNRVRGSDLKTYSDIMVEIEEAEPPKGIPQEAFLQWKRQTGQSVTMSWLPSIEPEKAKIYLATREFDGLLAPEQIERIGANADVEIRRKKLEAEAAERAAMADAKEQIDQFNRELGDGVPKSDEDMARMQAVADKYGFTKQGYDLGKFRVQAMVNREFRDATPAQIDMALKEVQTAIANKKDKAGPYLIVREQQLQKLLDVRKADAAADPLAGGAKMGLKIDPVNFADPASIARRREVAEASARSLGVAPRYLTDEEAGQLRADMATPAGRMRNAAILAQFGGVSAGRAAEQVAPDDALFAYSLGLNANQRKSLYEGEQLLKDKLVTVKASDTLPQWNAAAAKAVERLPTSAKGAVYQIAVRMYAKAAHDRGLEDFHAGLFDVQVHRAMGGSIGADGVRIGGIGEWNGETVALPPAMSQTRFESLMARIPDRPDKYPRYVNGSRIPMSELRANWTPVAVAPGVYQFRNRRGEYAEGGDGRLYDFDMNVFASKMK